MKEFFKSQFEKIMEYVTLDVIQGAAAELQDICDAVQAFTNQNLIIDQGIDSGICSIRVGSGIQCEIIMANLYRFRNLQQVCAKGGQLFMERWPESLRKVSILNQQDLRPLNRLKNLQALSTMGDPVKLADLSSLQNQLRELCFCKSEDEESLQNFPNIDFLAVGTLHGAQPAAGLKNLRRMFVENFQAKNLDGIHGCENLEILRIQSDMLNDISAVSDLKRLRKLILISLRKSGVSDLSPLCDLPLKSLCISGGPLLDFSPLEKMPHLTDLHLESCFLERFSLLEPLTELETLRFDNLLADDYDALLKLPKLRKIEAPSGIKAQFSDALTMKIGEKPSGVKPPVSPATVLDEMLKGR